MLKGHPRIARLLLLALVGSGLVAAPSATAADPNPNDFGPPPYYCVPDQPGDGCYGVAPGEMHDTYVADLTIDDHVVRVGESVTASASDLGWGATWDWGVPGCDANAPTCTFPAATTPSSGWQIFTIDFPASSGTGIEQDYYVVVGSEWVAISGTVQRRPPVDRNTLVGAGGVSVTASGSGGTYTQPTRPNGTYVVWVKRGTYSITVDGGGSGAYCEASALPGTCNRSVSKDVQDDVTVNWSQPPFHHVRGKVTSADDKPIEGAVIRVAPSGDTGAGTATATSDENGDFDVEAQEGQVVIDSADSTLCVKDDQASCTKSKSLDLHSNVRVDFVRKGCAKEVSFESNMVATGDCFKIVDAGKIWTADAAFWMNGLRLTPVSGVVTLDKTLKTIASPDPVKVSVPLPDGSEPVLYTGPIIIPFSELFGTLSNKLFPGGLSFSNSPAVGGLGLKAGLKLIWGPGTTTLEGSLDLSELQWQLNEKLEGNLVKANKDGIVVRAIAENGKGLHQLQGEFAPGKDVIFPPGGDKGKQPKFVKLTRLAGVYDYSGKKWRFSGEVEAAFLSKTKGGFAGGSYGGDVLAVPTIKATVDIDGNSFFPERVVGEGNTINRQLPYGFFLQRLNFVLGQDALVENSPFEIGVGIGISFLPSTKEETKIPFRELAAADIEAKLVDADRDVTTLGDLGLIGKGTLKIVDHSFLTGTLELYPGQGSLVVEGAVDHKIPLPGGSSFGIDGRAAGWFDGINNQFAAEGDGHWALPYLGKLGARWAATENGLAGCMTDTQPKPDLVIGGVPVGRDGETTDLYGIVYDWYSGTFTVGGCNLEPFTRPRPTASAAATSVTVPRGTRVLGVRAVSSRGGKAPAVQVSGPSGKAMVDPAKGIRLKWLHALRSSGGTTTLVLVKPKPGRYSVTANGARILTARPAPPSRITGSLASKGCTRTLRWRAKRIPGQQIRLLDAGEQSVRVVGTSSKASGSAKVSPGGAGRRTLIAQALQGGVVRSATVLAAYDAPTDLPSAATSLRVTRLAGGAIRISWSAGCNASRYSVVAGGGKPVETTKTSLTVRKPRRGLITVTSLSPDGKPGGAITRKQG